MESYRDILIITVSDPGHIAICSWATMYPRASDIVNQQKIIMGDFVKKSEKQYKAVFDSGTEVMALHPCI